MVVNKLIGVELVYYQCAGDVDAIAQLKRLSPVAWPHVNLHGRFQFNDQPQLIDMDSIIQTLGQMPTLPEIVTNI